MICTREGWKFRTSNPIVIDKAINALLLKNLSQKKVDVLNGIRQFYRQK